MVLSLETMKNKSRRLWKKKKRKLKLHVLILLLTFELFFFPLSFSENWRGVLSYLGFAKKLLFQVKTKKARGWSWMERWWDKTWYQSQVVVPVDVPVVVSHSQNFQSHKKVLLRGKILFLLIHAAEKTSDLEMNEPQYVMETSMTISTKSHTSISRQIQ